MLCALLAGMVAGCGGEEGQGDGSSGTSAGVDRAEDSAGSSTEAKRKADEVQLRLNWFPEAEHGGFYAALVHGFFEEEHLRVTIQKGGPGVPVREEVATGRVQFGISNADQILVARAREADIVGVFASLQTSPRCIMVHEKSRIRSFDDLKNVTLAMNENSSFGAFLKKSVSLEGCTIVPYPGNVSQFLLNDDFVQQGYVFSEPFVAKQKGGDPHNLMAADIGFNPYTSVLIVNGDLIRDKPDLVRRFVRATRRGWEKYLADPEMTNRLLHEQNPEMDLDILAFGAAELRRLCAVENADSLGSMQLVRWQTMLDQLVDCEIVEDGSISANDAFTTRFLNDADVESGASESTE